MTAPAEPLTREQLQALVDAGRHAEIDAARRQGRLEHLLTADAPTPSSTPVASSTSAEPMTRDEVQRLVDAGRHADVDAARRAGRLEHLLSPGPTP